MFELPFIEHRQVSDIFRGLHRSVRSRTWAAVVGASGTGKERLVREFANRRALHQLDLRQFVLVDAVPPRNRKISQGDIASAAARITFSRLRLTLNVLQQLPYRAWEDTFAREPARTYDDDRFLELYEQVLKAIIEQQTKVLIVMHGEHLDASSLYHISQLQKDCRYQFGVILAATLPFKKAKPFELVTEVFSEVVRARMACTEPILVTPLEKKEFERPVLSRLFYALNADATTEVKRDASTLADTLWGYSQGNWHAITRIAELFNLELETTTRGIRWVTPSVVDRVTAQLSTIREWQLG